MNHNPNWEKDFLNYYKMALSGTKSVPSEIIMKKSQLLKKYLLKACKAPHLTILALPNARSVAIKMFRFASSAIS